MRHPDPLRTPDGPVVLIADPLADKLAGGDAVLGWGGDDQLALYVNHKLRRWELWRLEDDGVYRMTTARPARPGNACEVVAEFIACLVRCDTRRGFDPAQAVIDATLAREAARAREVSERNQDFADKLSFALHKDIGATTVGLSRRLIAVGS